MNVLWDNCHGARYRRCCIPIGKLGIKALVLGDGEEILGREVSTYVVDKLVFSSKALYSRM